MRKDCSQSRLANGVLTPKDDVRMEAVGTIDELNSHIGWLASEVPEEYRLELQQIQRHLFSISAVVSQSPLPIAYEEAELVDELHARIAEWNKRTGGFRGFILPGGCRVAAQAHVCRSVCRRAERRLVTVGSTHIGIAFLNALSSYFFSMALLLNNIYECENIKL